MQEIIEETEGENSNMQVDLVFDDNKNIWNAEISGQIDVYTAPQLKESLSETYNSGKNADLSLDFANLEYIDSTGLGVLIGVLKNLKQNGNQVSIKGMRENVKKVFVITGLDKIFNLEV